jgi:hypothetical protein
MALAPGGPPARLSSSGTRPTTTGCTSGPTWSRSTPRSSTRSRCRPPGNVRTAPADNISLYRPLMAAVIRRVCPGLGPSPKGTHDRPMAKLIAQAMNQAGIRSSQRSHKVSDYLLEQIIGEGPGYQDWQAVHCQVADSRRRVRLYLVRTGAMAGERQTRERAALREFQLLETLQHPGILRAYNFTEHELGPALSRRWRTCFISWTTASWKSNSRRSMPWAVWPRSRTRCCRTWWRPSTTGTWRDRRPWRLPLTAPRPDRWCLNWPRLCYEHWRRLSTPTGTPWCRPSRRRPPTPPRCSAKCWTIAMPSRVPRRRRYSPIASRCPQAPARRVPGSVSGGGRCHRIEQGGVVSERRARAAIGGYARTRPQQPFLAGKRRCAEVECPPCCPATPSSAAVPPAPGLCWLVFAGTPDNGA